MLNILRSLKIIYSMRHRLADGVWHDINQRYVGSLFGVIWVILFPLLQLSVYAALYTIIFKVRPSGLTEYDYVILVFSGLIPLLTFNEIVTATTNSLSMNKNLLLNTVFPSELIPLRVALAAQVPGLFGLLITVTIGLFLGSTNWQGVRLIPGFWGLVVMFAVGIGWILSLLSLVARDIQHGLGIVLITTMVLSPFAYTPEMVPSSLKVIIYFNPLSYFVLSFQQLICYGIWPDWLNVMGAVFLALSSFLVGFVFFQRAKHIFFDYS